MPTPPTMCLCEKRWVCFLSSDFEQNGYVSQWGVCSIHVVWQLILEQSVCVCMYVHATEWGVGSWSMVVLTDLRDVASRAGQQLTVLRICVTCSAPSASRSDDILPLMSKVSMTVLESHRAVNQLPSTGHSHRKDYVMSRRGRPLVMEQGELRCVCSLSFLKERPVFKPTQTSNGLEDKHQTTTHFSHTMSLLLFHTHT